MKQRYGFLLFAALLWACFGQAQTASIRGIVYDNSGNPLNGVTVQIMGSQTGTSTNNEGKFQIQVRAGRGLALEFSHTGYQAHKQNFFLNRDEDEEVFIRLMPGETVLAPVEVTTVRQGRIAGIIGINPKLVQLSPAPISGVEALIKVLVGSNNELSSQYNVRGGAFDENLIYVNDFEIYRPYLVRNGQQEGLSFINPALVKNIHFYNGGFQAKYGDKMSSALDVHYKTPTHNAGSLYLGLLEQGLHLEGSRNKKFTWLAGARNRSLRNLLTAQETKGNYMPSSSDVQVLFGWKPDEKWQLELLGNLSSTQFGLLPEESRQTTSVFTPFFQMNLGLDVDFSGREKDKFSTRFAGFTASKNVNSRFSYKFMLSHLQNREAERINISGSYLFGDREFDPASSDFGLIINPLGAGEFLQYARNELKMNISNVSVRGTWRFGDHFLQAGQSFEIAGIEDVLNEFNYQDSAGFSLPNNPGPFQIQNTLNASNTLITNRLHGFIQDNISFGSGRQWAIQAGMRYHYNFLNHQFIASPRVNLSFAPLHSRNDVVYRLNAGRYAQPPFYREMRNPDGRLNKDLLAQDSWQLSGAIDYVFSWMNRPFRFTGETYYKLMNHVVSYDIDNVRLRYSGMNDADARVWGIEGRLFGEIVKDAESWLSVGFMNARENLYNDFYLNYLNAAGEIIGPQTEDRVVADTREVEIGWLRRPTDRRLNIGLFFSDYLTTDNNFRTHLQLLYGSNLPYNIPGSTKYRNAMEIPAYLRVDVGFMYRLAGGDQHLRRSHDPFRKMKNIWISAEVFNLLDRGNTISYTLIKDFSNNTFTIPNRLTPRLLNFKISFEF